MMNTLIWSLTLACKKLGDCLPTSYAPAINIFAFDTKVKFCYAYTHSFKYFNKGAVSGRIRVG